MAGTPSPTTIPLASSSSSYGIAKQKRLERSCILCHQRKIRCDKKSPCGNCGRADILCYYPKPEQNVRRPHKTTIADVSARLARLERTISALSNDSPIQQDNPLPDLIASDEFVQADGAASGGSPSWENLIQGDSSSQYFNEAMLSHIMEEEQEIQSLIGIYSGKIDRAGKAHTEEIEPLLSSFHKPHTGELLYEPSRRCAIQLWQTFVNNVDPLFKILHIPTTQGMVYSAINNPSQVGADTNALLSSIYFAGISSLSNEYVMNILGKEKTMALNDFKRGLEQSLAMSNFLDTPTFASLQAITIYIGCLRSHNKGRALWALNGLVIRSAQSIGLHRDGKNFDLSPFRCEMRRRLWWHIMANDARVAEDHGLMISSFDATIDVALPLNVDDSQLDPSMKELPVVEQRWTEMTFPLIIFEAINALHGLHQRTTHSINYPPSEAIHNVTCNSLKEHFEKNYLPYCDQNIPVQRATFLIGQILSRKFELKTRQQWPKISASTSTAATPFSSSQRASQTTEEILVSACEILEISLKYSTEDMLEGFQWIFHMYPQYDVMMYVLWHLCIMPEGPLVEKAWQLVNACFEIEAMHQVGWKWAVLRRLREKAANIRASVGGPETVNGVMTGHSYGGEIIGSDSTYNDIIGTEFPLCMNWTPHQFAEADWSTLMENFDM
ncbi:fungal-specific transcription factor domain-containing protein [Bisporella sp. PMI_857]|nr:fungal-specific transcription factor domain-containing protein [Bisporella sp. PMI_857]